MKKLSLNKGWLFIGGIILVLFLHFVPVTACDTNNMYNTPGKEIIMAPGQKAFKLNEKHVKLIKKDVSTERDS
jgi:hypothetical protein